MADATAPSALSAAPKLDASSTTFSPSTTTGENKEHVLWADELASPVADKNGKELGGQLDGASEVAGGSQLHDTQYDVEVKLSDIQGDVNSPLYSVTSFDELGMRVSNNTLEQASADRL